MKPHPFALLNHFTVPSSIPLPLWKRNALSRAPHAAEKLSPESRLSRYGCDGGCQPPSRSRPGPGGASGSEPRELPRFAFGSSCELEPIVEARVTVEPELD